MSRVTRNVEMYEMEGSLLQSHNVYSLQHKASEQYNDPYVNWRCPIPSPFVAVQDAVSRLILLRGTTSSPSSIFLATADVFLSLLYVSLEEIRLKTQDM